MPNLSVDSIWNKRPTVWYYEVDMFFKLPEFENEVLCGVLACKERT